MVGDWDNYQVSWAAHSLLLSWYPLASSSCVSHAVACSCMSYVGMHIHACMQYGLLLEKDPLTGVFAAQAQIKVRGAWLVAGWWAGRLFQPMPTTVHIQKRMIPVALV